MRVFWKGCAVLAAMSMVLSICACAAKKAASHPGGCTNGPALLVKDKRDGPDASGPSPEEAAGNVPKHEVRFTQIHDAAIVGSDLLIVGRARVLSEVSGEMSRDNAVTEIKAPFQEQCFALIRGGMPAGKEFRIVGKGWRESKPVKDGEYLTMVTLTDMLTCELTPGP